MSKSVMVVGIVLLLHSPAWSDNTPAPTTDPKLVLESSADTITEVSCGRFSFRSYGLGDLELRYPRVDVTVEFLRRGSGMLIPLVRMDGTIRYSGKGPRTVLGLVRPDGNYWKEGEQYASKAQAQQFVQNVINSTLVGYRPYWRELGAKLRYDGQETIDGTLCDIITAESVMEDLNMRWYIGKTDRFPRRLEQISVSKENKASIIFDVSRVETIPRLGPERFVESDKDIPAVSKYLTWSDQDVAFGLIKRVIEVAKCSCNAHRYNFDVQLLQKDQPGEVLATGSVLVGRESILGPGGIRIDGAIVGGTANEHALGEATPFLLIGCQSWLKQYIPSRPNQQFKGESASFNWWTSASNQKLVLPFLQWTEFLKLTESYDRAAWHRDHQAQYLGKKIIDGRTLHVLRVSGTRPPADCLFYFDNRSFQMARIDHDVQLGFSKRTALRVATQIRDFQTDQKLEARYEDVDGTFWGANREVFVSPAKENVQTVLTEAAKKLESIRGLRFSITGDCIEEPGSFVSASTGEMLTLRQSGKVAQWRFDGTLKYPVHLESLPEKFGEKKKVNRSERSFPALMYFDGQSLHGKDRDGLFQESADSPGKLMRLADLTVLLPALLEDAPFSWELACKELKYEGKAMIRGVECHVILAGDGGLTEVRRWFIGTADGIPRAFHRKRGRAETRVLMDAGPRPEPQLAENDIIDRLGVSNDRGP